MHNMKILGIIPARYASTRFPGKPMAVIGGKTMIRRVYDQACKARGLTNVVVATDDQRIFDEVVNHGGKAMMTSANHLNGTERCEEVMQKSDEQYDYAINIQGDEPFIQPEMIDQLAAILDGETQLGTLVKKVEDPASLDNPNTIKVTFSRHMKALYFSRSCIPFLRGGDPGDRLRVHDYYKHIGIYAYRADILKEITRLPAGSLETAESLEQLRWLENGYQIVVAETKYESHGVDVPEDLERIKKLLKHG